MKKTLEQVFKEFEDGWCLTYNGAEEREKLEREQKIAFQAAENYAKKVMNCHGIPEDVDCEDGGLINYKNLITYILEAYFFGWSDKIDADEINLQKINSDL